MKLPTIPVPMDLGQLEKTFCLLDHGQKVAENRRIEAKSVKVWPKFQRFEMVVTATSLVTDLRGSDKCKEGYLLQVVASPTMAGFVISENGGFG